MSTIKVDTIQSTNGGKVALTDLFVPTSYLTLDGSAPQIDKSGNISSFTDRAVGAYTAVFTSNMPDADYSITLGFTDTLLSTSAQQFGVGYTASETSSQYNLDTRKGDIDGNTFAIADISRISVQVIP